MKFHFIDISLQWMDAMTEQDVRFYVEQKDSKITLGDVVQFIPYTG